VDDNDVNGREFFAGTGRAPKEAEVGNNSLAARSNPGISCRRDLDRT
jgi:hypothetical protein